MLGHKRRLHLDWIWLRRRIVVESAWGARTPRGGEASATGAFGGLTAASRMLRPCGHAALSPAYRRCLSRWWWIRRRKVRRMLRMSDLPHLLCAEAPLSRAFFWLGRGAGG